VDIVRMEEIRAPRHIVGFIYRSFTVENVHTMSERHQSFNPMNLIADQFFYHLIDLANE
jgi:hypothetical protein